MTLLERFGWSAFFESRFLPFAEEGLVPARVVREERESCLVVAPDGEFVAETSGRLRHAAKSRLDLPAVGDWVALRSSSYRGPEVIDAVLPRRNRLARKAAGDAARVQVLAANVDVLLITMALDGDFNPRRLERYAALAWESEAIPLVVLTKADSCANVEPRVAEARAVTAADALAVSAATGAGLPALAAFLLPGKTHALLGMSGVGKSTLVNALFGIGVQAVGETRASDGRGRHTTTRRDLLLLPEGALLLDAPGMRELALWDGPGDAAFEDIESLAPGCRFRDCAHGGEPGCAVGAAVAEGRLDRGRLESHRKLLKESAWLSRREDAGLARAERERWKSLTCDAKRQARFKREPQ
ncbi:MAG: ribosome small subunit-dependent GTPase A [Acidobacteriota bacterium]